MILIIVVAVLLILVGALGHKWIVKEDLLLAAKVKALVGKKVAEAKAELAKVVPEVKPEEKK